MTNKEGIDEGDENCDSRLAALLAVHLVGQVLEEAYITANAARESGQPWRYLMMKNLRNDKTSKIENDDVSYATSKGDNVTFVTSTRDEAKEISDDKANVLSNQVVTSTPQKKSGAMGNDIKENNVMGRGDEEYEKTSNDLTNSTSTYINHLFDMSEVEKVIFCDDNVPAYCDNTLTNPEAMAPLQDIAEMVKSYVNVALSMALTRENEENESEITRDSSRGTDQSCYSFLSDAFMFDSGKDDAFFVDQGESNGREPSVEPMIEEVTLERDIKNKEEEITDDKDRTEINTALYENVYLTLNRDYEQCSEDGDPVLQDPKGLSLQEVELMTAHTSAENLSLVHEEPQQHCEELAATSAITASASSRKSNLVHRCRTQGARLLACLRGWWRRKTPGKRKDSRVPGAIRGLCPLSPDARRRAASLLDQRHLRSPTPSHSIVWKFNTVNEALVNSSRWKEYTFDVKPDECGEY